MKEKRIPIGLKLDAKLLAKLRAKTIESKEPYAPTMTQAIERGIELALVEIEKKR
jgi:hypothetical protein